MNTSNTYKHSLYKGSKKWKCPACGERSAVLYVDNGSGEFLPDHVARCDRQNNCGYHFTPAQYFKEKGLGGYRPEPPNYNETYSHAVSPEISYIPFDYLEKSVNPKLYKNNWFVHFLIDLFGLQIAEQVTGKYLIGTSKHWAGAHVWWQIDSEMKIRQCKVMLCDPETGKRMKEYEPCYYGKRLLGKDKVFELCFFGEFLLTIEGNENKPVCIVESEKTAIIASVFYPDFIWLATGGASGCKWREYSVYKALAGRSVTFFPDYGYFNRKSEKTCYAEWCERVERIREALPGTKIKVSDLLEKTLQGQERNDDDLADILIQKWNGYPVVFDNLIAA